MGFEQVRFRDDGRLKLLIIVGTRPEIIRLSEVIKKGRVQSASVQTVPAAGSSPEWSAPWG